MSDEPVVPAYEFDLALSFAGDNRFLVDAFVAELGQFGLTYFYDKENQAEMLGEDLLEMFQKVYHDRSRFMVMFISEAYVRKNWPTHERRSGQARALESRDSYILPLRLDDAVVPGLQTTTGFVDVRLAGIREAAAIVAKKVGQAKIQAESPPSRLTPRSRAELERLIASKGYPEEYRIYAGSLLVGIAEHDLKYADFEIGFATAGVWKSDAEVLEFSLQMRHKMIRIIDNFGTIISPKVWTAAFGEPGEPGDISRVQHLAQRYVDTYVDLLDWAAEVRAVNASENGAALLRVLGSAASPPINLLRERPKELADQLDLAFDRPADSEPQVINLRFHLQVPEGWIEQMGEAEERLADA